MFMLASQLCLTLRGLCDFGHFRTFGPMCRRLAASDRERCWCCGVIGGCPSVGHVFLRVRVWIYAHAACTYMCMQPYISTYIWFNSLSCPIPRQFIIRPSLPLSAPWHRNSPTPLFSSFFHLHLCLCSSVPRSVIYCGEAWSDLLRT